MSLTIGLLLVGVALMSAWTLEEYVARREAGCTEMLGMMVGMAAGMMTGLIVGEVAGFFAGMFWGNLLAMLVGLTVGSYLGRHGRLMGMLDGGMAGMMGGMMGAMLGVMLQFSAEYALVTGVLLLLVQLVATGSVAYLVDHGTGPASVRSPVAMDIDAKLPDYYAALRIAPDATRRDVAAAYLALTDPDMLLLAPEEQRLADAALAVLTDPISRSAYDRAHSRVVPRERESDAAPAGKTQPLGDVPTRETEPLSGQRAHGTRWGTAALLAFAVIAFGLVGARPATATCPSPAQADGLPELADSPPVVPTGADAEATTAPLIGGKQMVNLTIQYPCYYPDKITVRRGVPVEFNVGAVGEPGCGRQLMLQGLGIGKYVPPGKIATFEFTPPKAGAYSINCGMSMMKPATLRVVD
jgi:hypothetical protein